MDFVKATITKIIFKNNKVYIDLQTQRGSFKQVLFLSGGVKYKPKINEEVLLYRPLKQMGASYLFAIATSYLSKILENIINERTQDIIRVNQLLATQQQTINVFTAIKDLPELVSAKPTIETAISQITTAISQINTSKTTSANLKTEFENETYE